MVGQKEVVRQRNWFRESRLPRRASLDLEEGSASIKVSHLAQVRLVGRIIGWKIDSTTIGLSFIYELQQMDFSSKTR